jgi:hypothetical protein
MSLSFSSAVLLSSAALSAEFVWALGWDGEVCVVELFCVAGSASAPHEHSKINNMVPNANVRWMIICELSVFQCSEPEGAAQVTGVLPPLMRLTPTVTAFTFRDWKLG